jgi:hypothetical protein
MNREQLAADVFRRAGASIEVTSVPLTDVVAEARARRGRRRRAVVAGVVAAVVVIAGVAWLTGRSSPGSDEPGALDVKPAPNPVDVAWYAGGRLHLDDVTVSMPQLTDIIELNGGAVYADVQGTVGFVGADGERRRLGTKDPDTLLVGSTADGWVAWIDPAGRIVVHDVSTDDVVDTRDVTPGDVQLVAIDQHRIFYRDGDGAYAWTPGVETAERLVRDGLVDVESATRLYQEGPRIDMVQSVFNVDFLRPGIGGMLSPGGTFVLTRSPGGGPAGSGEPFQALLYDARSGDRVVTGVRGDERVVDAAFGDNNTITYLVVQASDLTGGADLDGNVDPLLLLRTCTIGGGCNDIAPVSTGTDRPLLAG